MNKTGLNYLANEVLTVTDSQLGGYGYADITFNIQTVINVFDQTKQNNGTAQLSNATNAIIDSAIKKFGSDSLKFQAENHFRIIDINLNTNKWTLQAWFRIETGIHSSANSQPTFFFTVPNDGSNPANELRLYVDGDQTSGDYGKVKLVSAGTEVMETASATIWTNFAADAWVHIALVKDEPTLGTFNYTVFSNGTQIGQWNTTTNIPIDDVYVGGLVTPTAYTSLLGNVDDFVIDDDAQYTGSSFTAPDAEVPVRTLNSSLVITKTDREHLKRGTYTLTGLSEHTQMAYVEETGWTYNSFSQPPMTPWLIGPGGLQILDYADVSSQLIPGTFTFDNDYFTYGSKTSTVPTPGGKKLKITPIVTPKYYIKDAAYSKIDSVQELIFNQDVQFTKGQILQQYNDSGVVQRYGTIVEVPVGEIETPGLGTTYRIGKIYPAGATFSTNEEFQTDLASDNAGNVISLSLIHI